jgi:hypothetical protein
LGPYDGKVDVFSTGIMAAELVVRHMDVDGFDRVPAARYQNPDERPALVDDACRRLDTVCPGLSSVVRRCSAMKAKHRLTSVDALRALQEVDVGGVVAAGSGTAAGAAGGAVATAVSPPPLPGTQWIDMSDAAAAMVSLQVPTDVANRVCDAMAGVAAADGSVTGAQLLRIVVDEGVPGLTAMELRRRLRITAAVPPRRVRWLCRV